MSPPTWLRRFVSYRVLTAIDRRFNFCWANMVLWKEYGSTDDWAPTSTCFDNIGEPLDYCGKFEAEPWCRNRCLKRLAQEVLSL